MKNNSITNSKLFPHLKHDQRYAAVLVRQYSIREGSHHTEVALTQITTALRNSYQQKLVGYGCAAPLRLFPPQSA